MFFRSSPNKQSLFLFGLAGVSLGGYLFASSLIYRSGFPLDDAWIHQTYARNLGLLGEWAYQSGELSAGSTAPLWTVLLAIGYVLHLQALPWAYLLGGALLGCLALIASYYCKDLDPSIQRVSWGAGVLVLLEWHLVWAAGSGMETLALALMVLAILWQLTQKMISWLVVGLLIGISIWLRPDGVTLLGPSVFVLVMSQMPLKQKMAAAWRLGLGVVLLFSPYLVFNRLLAGTWWPNTFFAKQAEYAVLREAPLWIRIWNVGTLPLIGVGVILLPGFLLWMGQAIQRRKWTALAAPLWFIGYVGLYAWRLPVTYQHGRYIIPAIPVFLILGYLGFLSYLASGSAGLWKRVLSRVWFISGALVLILFWGLGAQSYGRDVAIIESEMVDIAHWVANNTPEGALIAAHDIGALGYFGERPLLDLAGLVTPEVIPFLRDEDRLGDYMKGRQVDYLVTFPAWYPQLSAQSEQVFATAGSFSPAAGGENMAVFRWK